MLFEEGSYLFAADFFFAFGDEADVDGECAALLEEGFEGLDVHPELALVVDGTAGVDVAVADCGLEGWGEPFVERIRRLDVEVAVEQDGGRAGGMEVVGVDEGVACGLDDLDVVHADAGEFGGEEGGGGEDVGGVLGEGADAGDAEEGFELVEGLIAVLVGEG